MQNPCVRFRTDRVLSAPLIPVVFLLTGLAAYVLPQAKAAGPTGTATTTPHQVPPPELVKAVIGHLGPVPVPPENPLTRAKAELGQKLFEDTGLAADGSLSCQSCHLPDHGWAVPQPLGPAYTDRQERRNSPTLINVAYNLPLLWDGRAASLDKQTLGPLQNPLHQNSKLDMVVERLGKDEDYRTGFQAAFGDSAPTPERIAMALGSFERTLVYEDSPLDRYMDGDEAALDEAQKRGLALFFGKAGCAGCHNGPNLTDHQFHSLGVPDTIVTGNLDVMATVRFDAQRMKLPGWEAVTNDPGRELVTHDPADRGKFRTMGLRNVEQSPPYMHNGALATLEDVVVFYNRGSDGGVLRPLGLSEQEQRDLLALLRALTGKQRQPAWSPSAAEAAPPETSGRAAGSPRRDCAAETTPLLRQLCKVRPLPSNRDLE
jgi:cytochrome c peroxidase